MFHHLVHWRIKRGQMFYHSSQSFRYGDELVLILMAWPLGMWIYIQLACLPRVLLRSPSGWLKLTNCSYCTQEGKGGRTEGRTNNVQTRSRCGLSSDNCQHALCAMKGRASVRWSQGLDVTRRASHPAWGRWRRGEERKTERKRERGQEIRMKHSSSCLSDSLPNWWD